MVVAAVVRKAVAAAKVGAHLVAVAAVAKEMAAVGPAARATHLAVVEVMRLQETVAKANRFENAVWPN